MIFQCHLSILKNQGKSNKVDTNGSQKYQNVNDIPIKIERIYKNRQILNFLATYPLHWTNFKPFI